MQRGLTPKIEASRLDGSNRRLLHSHALSWPEDVAFDTLRDAIFWTDSKLRTIEMSFADGSGRKAVRKYGMQADHHFAVSGNPIQDLSVCFSVDRVPRKLRVFNNDLYVTFDLDLSHESKLVRVAWWSDNDVTLMTGLTPLSDVLAIHPLLQSEQPYRECRTAIPTISVAVTCLVRCS